MTPEPDTCYRDCSRCVPDGIVIASDGLVHRNDYPETPPWSDVEELYVDAAEPVERIRLWVSAHDNGWEAWIAQHHDGTFTAWACPTAQNAVATYIEDSFEDACAAALFDLQRLSDHDACSHRCSSWHERESL